MRQNIIASWCEVSWSAIHFPYKIFVIFMSFDAATKIACFTLETLCWIIFPGEKSLERRISSHQKSREFLHRELNSRKFKTCNYHRCCDGGRKKSIFCAAIFYMKYWLEESKFDFFYQLAPHHFLPSPSIK